MQKNTIPMYLLLLALVLTGFHLNAAERPNVIIILAASSAFFLRLQRRILSLPLTLPLTLRRASRPISHRSANSIHSGVSLMSPESFIYRMKSSLSSRKSLTSSQSMPTRKPGVPLSLLSWVRRIKWGQPEDRG